MDFLRRRFILIADDNQDLAISLSMLLQLVGFEVETVHTGGEAVTAAKTPQAGRPPPRYRPPRPGWLSGSPAVPQRRRAEGCLHHRHFGLLAGDVTGTPQAGGFRPLFHQARRFQNPAVPDPQGGLASPRVASLTKPNGFDASYSQENVDDVAWQDSRTINTGVRQTINPRDLGEIAPASRGKPDRRDLGIDHVLRHQPRGRPEHPLGHRPAGRRPDVGRGGRPVRGQDDVVQRQERILERAAAPGEDVERRRRRSGAPRSASTRRRLIDELAPGHVDEVGGRLHQRELPGPIMPRVAGGQAAVEAEEVGLAEHLFERRQTARRGPRPPPGRRGASSARTRIANGATSRASSRPLWPRPTIPSVRPADLAAHDRGLPVPSALPRQPCPARTAAWPGPA